MKKLLLFLIIPALGLTFLYGQKNTTPELKKMVNKSFMVKQENPLYQNFLPVTIQPSSLHKSVKSVDAIPFSSSGNAYTMFSGNHLTSDQTSNRVLFVHRAGGPWGDTVSSIKFKMTPDWGLTWDSVLYKNSLQKRYPGGSFFRKDGDVDLRLVASGPITSGGAWVSNYFYSAKIDGTEKADTVINYPSSTYLYHINNVIALGNGRLYDLGERIYVVSGDTIRDGLFIHKGIWNSTDKKFNYTTPAHITHLFSKKQPPVQPVGHAWSKDGAVGYVWWNGMDSLGIRPNKSTQPIVYKSTDHGMTWNKMPTYDYGSIPEVRNYLWHCLSDTSICRPVFFYGYTTSDNEMPGTVDANGNLHLAVTMQGGYSNNDDSLGYTFTYEPTKIFDLFTTTTGWDARYVDTLASDVDDGTHGSWSTVQLDHRIHIGRSDDGNVICVTWSDTDPSYADMNVFPDVNAWAYNIITDESTLPKDFTVGSAYEGLGMYMTGPEIILTEGNKYKIPVTYLSSPSFDPDDPIIHYLLTGIEFDQNEFGPNAGIGEKNNTNATLSANYPNPFSGQTSIDITLNNPENVTLQVYNMMGKMIMEENFGKMSRGVHHITLNLDEASGIYLYVIKAGSSVLSNKMTVQ